MSLEPQCAMAGSLCTSAILGSPGTGQFSFSRRDQVLTSPLDVVKQSADLKAVPGLRGSGTRFAK
jgi:hypothetical protein